MLAVETVSEILPTNLQTVDAFEAWANQHVHEGSFEFVRGQIIPKEAMKQNEYFLVKFLTRLFSTTNAFKRGDELTPEMDSYVDGRRKRVPDLAYFTNDQINATRQSIRQSTTFAIELLSASESFEDVAEKIEDYFDAGAQLVWYIAPKRQRVYAYTGPDLYKVYKNTDTVTAEPVLSDFSFVINDLFAA